MTRWAGLGVALALCAFGTAKADNYAISVTRDDSNLYHVVGKDILIRTRACYEYAIADDAVLAMRGPAGTLVFLDDKESCDVEGVYASANEAAGKYSVSVSQDDDDWYAIDGTRLHVRTSMCLNLALGSDALLKLDGPGTGTLYFLDDNDHCDVEGVYGAMSL